MGFAVFPSRAVSEWETQAVRTRNQTLRSMRCMDSRPESNKCVGLRPAHLQLNVPVRHLARQGNGRVILHSTSGLWRCLARLEVDRDGMDGRL